MKKTYILLLLFAFCINVFAQQACPGLKNPINFMLYSSYSGQTGTKPSRASNCNAGTVGLNLSNNIISNTQLAQQTSNMSTSYCGSTIDNSTRFRIMDSADGPGTGARLGYDPCTNYGLPYCPRGFHKSIRVGQCRISAEAEALYYTMNVTPGNALVFIHYAIVVQAPGHGVTSDPEFIIRVTKQQGNTYVPINDTLCYVVSSTPSTMNGGTVTIGQDGWHSYGSGYSEVYYRDWNLVAINLYNYLYQNVRIEVMIGDCSASGHYGYCYIAGDCQPMRLDANGCAAGESDTVARISAPKGLSAYKWYKSRTGHLSGSAETDSNNYIVIPGETDSVLNIIVDYFTTVNGDTVPHQSFMCEMTSYMDPTKPIKSQLYTDAMNKKPRLALDTILECNKSVTLIDKSQTPIIERPTDNVDTSLTIWTFYNTPDTNSIPAYQDTGGKATYIFPRAGNYAVTVRTSAEDTTCWNKKTVIVRAIAPPEKPGFIFERNNICFRDTIAIADTTRDSYCRKWVIHHFNGETDTLQDTSRIIHISFDSTEIVQLIVSGFPAHVVDTNGNPIEKICNSDILDTIFVGKYPKLNIIGDTIVCIGNHTEIRAEVNNVENCTFEWYSSAHSSRPFSGNSVISVSPATDTWYYIKVTTHPNGCYTWDSIFIKVVNPGISADKTEVCTGDTVVITGSNAYSYSWKSSPEDANIIFDSNDAYNSSIKVVPQKTTTYIMTGHGSNGCSSSERTIKITVYPYPVIHIEHSPEFIDSENPVMTFKDFSEYGIRTLWHFGDGNTSNRREIEYTFTDISKDSIQIMMYSSNILGCTSDTCFYIPVILFSDWAPNVFTPTLGGENAIFKVYSANKLEHFTMYIYDRKGNLVFYSNEQNKGWNGYNIDGQKCVEGIYAYVYSYRRQNTINIVTRKGTIMLLK